MTFLKLRAHAWEINTERVRLKNRIEILPLVKKIGNISALTTEVYVMLRNCSHKTRQLFHVLCQYRKTVPCVKDLIIEDKEVIINKK